MATARHVWGMPTCVHVLSTRTQRGGEGMFACSHSSSASWPTGAGRAAPPRHQLGDELAPRARPPHCFAASRLGWRDFKLKRAECDSHVRCRGAGVAFRSMFWMQRRRDGQMENVRRGRGGTRERAGHAGRGPAGPAGTCVARAPDVPLVRAGANLRRRASPLRVSASQALWPRKKHTAGESCPRP